MQITELEVGQKVSFEVYPAHIYGSNFNNVTITAFFDYSLANALGVDVIATHGIVYPSLPSGTPNDATQYSYVQVRTDSGETVILGTPWIRDSTINILDGKKLTLVFQGINDTRMKRIIDAVKYINETPDHITFE